MIARVWAVYLSESAACDSDEALVDGGNTHACDGKE